MSIDWEGEVRHLLAKVLQRPLPVLPADTSLFGPELNLDSFSGMELLALIDYYFGLDFTADDLDFQGLETIGSLAAVLEIHGKPRRSR